jgi:hypothetical protein
MAAYKAGLTRPRRPQDMVYRSFMLEVLIAATRPGWSPASRWTWVAFGVLDAR